MYHTYNNAALKIFINFNKIEKQQDEKEKLECLLLNILGRSQ